MIRAGPGMWQATALGVAGLSVLLSAGCSTATATATGSASGANVSGNSLSVAPPQTGAASAPQTSASPAAPATQAAQARLETALRQAAGSGNPSSGQLREAVTAAGFAAGDVQVAASRTPTGLEADAVEVGVREGDGCLVGQVRKGTVNVIVLPVLADGRCLAGAAAPGM
ncbi:hypothetical protein [Arthrobacter sp. UYCu712]|uniref:DUF6993 domain-containing protein n=1 Tax=Arthrobacter sp. UYCu712 TaxID=3156340 RepID=UPI0033981DDC